MPRKSPEVEEYKPRTKFSAPSGFAEGETKEIKIPLTDEQFTQHLGEEVFKQLTAEDKAAINDSPAHYDAILKLNGNLIDNDEELRQKLVEKLLGMPTSTTDSEPPAPIKVKAPKPKHSASRSAKEKNGSDRNRDKRRRPSGKVLGAGAVLAAMAAAPIVAATVHATHEEPRVAKVDTEQYLSPDTQNVEQLREFFSQPDQNELTQPQYHNDFGPHSQAAEDGDHEGMLQDWEKLFRGRDTGAGTLATYACALKLPEAPVKPPIAELAKPDGSAYRDYMKKRTEFAERMKNDPVFHKLIYDKVMNYLGKGNVGDKEWFQGNDASDYINREGIDPTDPHFKEVLLDLSVSNRNTNSEYRPVVIVLDDGTTVTLLVKPGCFLQIAEINEQPLPQRIPIEQPPQFITVNVPQQQSPVRYSSTPTQVYSPSPTSIPRSTPQPQPQPQPTPYVKGSAEPTTPAITTGLGSGDFMPAPAPVVTQSVSPFGVPDSVTIAPRQQTGGFDSSPGVTRAPLSVSGPTGSVTSPNITRDTEIGSR